MARRSYRQHCGLAAALDVVAQRWALLIVRDLSPGPRRFTDLFDGLPGVSTDMLAQRLRELEQAGAIERVELREPVPATLYQLTDRGRELARIATDLAGWGFPLLPEPSSSELRFNARWALQTIAARYHGGLPDGRFHLTLVGTDDRTELLTLDLIGERARLRYGHRAEPPDATLTCTTREFFALRRDPDALAALEAGPGSTTASGRLGLLADLFRLVPLLAPGFGTETEDGDPAPAPPGRLLR